MDKEKKVKLTANMLEYGRQYREKHKDRIRETQRAFYKRNKKLKLSRRVYREPDEMGRLDLVASIEAHGGNIGFIEALKIIDCYDSIYGDRGKRIEGWDIESQLIYMYNKLKTFKPDTKKICSRCKRDLDVSNFSVNNNTTCGYHSECKECAAFFARKKRKDCENQ